MNKPVTCVPALPWHLLAMDARVKVVIVPEMLDQAITCLVGEEPLCCFGVTPLWPGVGFAWFMEQDRALLTQYAGPVARYVLRAWTLFAQDYHYVEALVVADRDDSRRLIEWLGFVPLAVKERYGPRGETMIEYYWRRSDGC